MGDKSWLCVPSVYPILNLSNIQHHFHPALKVYLYLIPMSVLFISDDDETDIREKSKNVREEKKIIPYVSVEVSK